MMKTHNKYLLAMTVGVLLIAFIVTLTQFLADARHLHAQGAFKRPKPPWHHDNINEQ